MTASSLPTRDRRALIVGSVVIALAILAFRGLPAWSHWKAETLATAAHAHHRLAEDRALVDALPETLADLEARLEKLREVRPLLMVGRNPADAAAALADHVEEAARSGRLDVRSLDVRPVDGESDLPQRVSVAMTARGDVTGLGSLLERLEGPPHLLVVRRLLVIPEDVESPREAEERLLIELTVEGLVLPGSFRNGGG